MFVINHLIGAVCVNPDWDTYMQWSVRVLTVGLSVVAYQWYDNYRYFIDHM